MEMMGISKFKAHTLKVLNQVDKTHEGIVITKRGRPIAQVLPCPVNGPVEMGKLVGTLTFEKDIVSPLGEAMRESSQ